MKTCEKTTTKIEPEKTIMVRRRWRLQRLAQKILGDRKEIKKPDGTSYTRYKYRIATCCRNTFGPAPTIFRSLDHLRARYSGLFTCGSVWHCALCAPLIARERAEEVNKAIASWRKEGGEVWFVTYTLQHDADRFGKNGLKKEMELLALCLAGMKGSRAFRKMMDDCRVLGAIRALEVMFGELNGWHAHTHEVVFAKAGGLAILKKIRRLWARQLIKHDVSGLRRGESRLKTFARLRNLMRHCFSIQNGDYAADYFLKYGQEPESERGSWGLGSEMTRSHMKIGTGSGARGGVPQRCDHVSPWGLLNDALDGDKRSEELFREFAEVFHGRRQIFWSKGLKEHFSDLDTRPDEEISSGDDADKQCSEYVCSIGPVSWARVLAADLRYDLLCVAATDGKTGVDRFLENLSRASPGFKGGEYVQQTSFFRKVA